MCAMCVMCEGEKHVVCGREVREDKEIKARGGKREKEKEKKSSESARESEKETFESEMEREKKTFGSVRQFLVRVVWWWCITKEITQGIVQDVQPWVIYF